MLHDADDSKGLREGPPRTRCLAASGEVAARHTGYLVGGTSPFGTRKPLPVCCEATIAGLPTLYINGGIRGFLVAMAPAELVRVLSPKLVRCGS